VDDTSYKDSQPIKVRKGGFTVPGNSIPDGHIDKLIESFRKDNFDVDENEGVFQFDGKVGIVATHKTAINSNNKKKKKVYYVEGSHYQMGYVRLR